MCIVQVNIFVLFDSINVSTLLDERHTYKGSPDYIYKVFKAFSKF